MYSRVKLWTSCLALVSALVTFTTGLVLLLTFHVGHGCYRPELLGLSRLAWQNLHRFAAAVILAFVAVHIAINLAPIGARLARTLRGPIRRQDAHELLFYATFTAVVLTGLVAWLALEGSLHVTGPTTLGPISETRHRWLDVHNVAGLLSLYLTVNHVRRRWSAFCALVRRVRPQRIGQGPVQTDYDSSIPS